MTGTRLQIVGSFVAFTLFMAPFAYQLTKIERVNLPQSRISQLVSSSSWFNSMSILPSPPPPPPPIQVYYANKATFEAEMERQKTFFSKKFVYKYHLLDQDLETIVQKALLDQKQRKKKYYYATLDQNLQHLIEQLQMEEQTEEEITKNIHTSSSSSSSSFRIFLLCESKLWWQYSVPYEKSPRLFVGPFRHAWSPSCSFKETMKAVENLLQNHIYPINTNTNTNTNTSLLRRQARNAFEYRLRFNLLKENPSESNWEWDFEFLFHRFFKTFLQKIHHVLGNFTIENQVFQFAKLTSSLNSYKKIQEQDEYYYSLLPQDFQQFLSANDFMSNSVLSDREQVFTFMAALPSLKHSPLVIQPSNSSSRNDEKYLYRSFEIPRWGNVFLLNSTLLLQENGIQKQQQKEMDLCFGLFLSQLRRLLGFPSFQKRQQQMEEETLHTSTSTTSTTTTTTTTTPTTTTTTTSKSKRTMIYFLPAIKDGFAQWELDVVVRQKIMENIKTTIQTLDSIVHLVNEMPQMSVLKRIEKLVTKALEEMEQVIQILSDQEHVYHHPFYQVDILYQQILPKTLDGAKAAEEAYYDHTMIRQLYFPQEQMFGVYAPLLAPLFLPFFLGFIREFKRFLLKKSTKLIVSKEN